MVAGSPMRSSELGASATSLRGWIEFLCSLLQIPSADAVVASEDARRQVPRKLHRDVLTDPGAHEPTHG